MKNTQQKFWTVIISLSVFLMIVVSGCSVDSPECLIDDFEDAYNSRNLTWLSNIFTSHFTLTANQTPLIREMASGEEIEEGNISLTIIEKRKQDSYYIATIDAQPDEVGRRAGVKGGIVDIKIIKTSSGWKIDSITSSPGEYIVGKDTGNYTLNEGDIFIDEIKLFEDKSCENLAKEANKIPDEYSNLRYALSVEIKMGIIPPELQNKEFACMVFRNISGKSLETQKDDTKGYTYPKLISGFLSVIPSIKADEDNRLEICCYITNTNKDRLSNEICATKVFEKTC